MTRASNDVITEDDMATDDEAKTRLRLWLRLLRVTRNVEGALRENFRVEYQSTLPRFDVMAALHRFPEGLKMSELSGVLKVSRGNMTGIIDRMVDEGLIIRAAVPGDRRALQVHLTRRGQKEFARQMKSHSQWIDELLSGIDVHDAQSIVAVLEPLISAKHALEGDHQK